ncbi:hypothetical protein FQN52_005420 [Onygenales sp. PD_12]|nr:hypothetical protein FQN52_005420 [Onygenales sp. PD_12]
MKSFIAYTSIALALISSLASAAPGSTGDPNVPPFTIRAITPPVGPGGPPPLSGQLRYVTGGTSGAVVVDATEGVEDFVAEMVTSPKGAMKIQKDEEPTINFWLEPLVDGISELKVGPAGQEGEGSRVDSFFATSDGCGAHCGGPMVVYDDTPDDDKFEGTWLAYSRDGGDGLAIRWVPGGEVPKGHTKIYLMRDSVPEE